MWWLFWFFCGVWMMVVGWCVMEYWWSLIVLVERSVKRRLFWFLFSVILMLLKRLFVSSCSVGFGCMIVGVLKLS